MSKSKLAAVASALGLDWQLTSQILEYSKSRQRSLSRPRLKGHAGPNKRPCHSDGLVAQLRALSKTSGACGTASAQATNKCGAQLITAAQVRRKALL